MPNKLMSIGEVAARLSRSVDFVRDETDAGRLKAEPRHDNGHRKYRELSVIAYEARYARGGGARQPVRPSLPAGTSQAPIRRPAPNPLPLPEDYWEDELEDKGPHVPTPREQVYLNGLVVAGMRELPYDIPGDWKLKMQTDLEQYITIDRFPYPESEMTAMQTIRLHVEGFLHGYHEAKRKEEEKEQARVSTERAGHERIRALVAYGRRLLELELSRWDWRDDPISDARTEIQAVLDAEVKADWTEGEVRDLVNEVLAEYEPDHEDDDDRPSEADQ